jgi:hypothetical protein
MFLYLFTYLLNDDGPTAEAVWSYMKHEFRPRIDKRHTIYSLEVTRYYLDNELYYTTICWACIIYFIYS